jgi:hypothetical protein
MPTIATSTFGFQKAANSTRASLSTAVLFLLTVPALAQVGSSGMLVGDFHNRSSLAQWRFSNGAEFPGASGSLSLGEGHSGSGAKLNYQIRCDSQSETCGHYVGAYRSVSVPRGRQFHALSLWASLPPEMRLVLRVEDETGQTLQYSVNTPTLEHQGRNAWNPVLVSLDEAPDDYWGGAENGHLKGRIVQVAILADSRNSVPTHGTLNFDDVWLLDSPNTTFNLDANARTIPVPLSSVSLSSRLAVNVHSLDDPVALDAARSAGFSFVRTDLLWATVEKNARYDFTVYDRFLACLEARGMGVLWILDYGHPDHGGNQPHTAADVTTFADYARAAAAHFAGHDVRYEIWNEPNLTSFLPDPSVYPALLSQAVAAIRQVDPSAVVVTGGVSGVDLNFLGSRAAAGPKRQTNAIGIHPYRTSGPETLVADLMLLRQLLDSQIRRDISIWDTEWGYSSYGFFPVNQYGDGHAETACKRQGVLAARRMLTVWALGFPVSVWYDLRDDGSNGADRESNFGLLDQRGNDKLSMHAVRTLTEAASRRNLDGALADMPAGLHGLKLTSDSDFTFIIWCDQPGVVSQVRLPVASLIEGTDMIGRKIPLASSSNQSAQVMVSEADGPVYIHWRRPPPVGYPSNREFRRTSAKGTCVQPVRRIHTAGR